MSKNYRRLLASLIVLFLYVQSAGILGYFFGFEGSAVLYNRWPGYFIGMGLAALVVILLFGFVLALVPLVNWVEKEQSNETRNKDQSADYTLYRLETPPTPPVSETVRRGTEDIVHGTLSRKAAREKRSGTQAFGGEGNPS